MVTMRRKIEKCLLIPAWVPPPEPAVTGKRRRRALKDGDGDN